VSGYRNGFTRRRMLENDMASFLSKSFEPNSLKLLRKVQTVNVSRQFQAERTSSLVKMRRITVGIESGAK
jgi:hypothetical protein